jgi:deoxyribodipyrimidine photo-lyase
MQKLEDEPAIETRCLHPACEGLRPREADAARLAAWEAGETGIPFVDACMRYLRATGWLNFRMRSMLVAVASYHLWLDWRATGPHLARMFTDYEPGIHWPQVQMQSGTTGMNTVRIYNPVKQGRDQDPSGAFTRAWVPEVRDVPDRFLQEPWTLGGRGAAPLSGARRGRRSRRPGGARGRVGRAPGRGLPRRGCADRGAPCEPEGSPLRQRPRAARRGDRRQMSLDL